MLRESVIDRALALEEFDETASGAILNQQVQLVLVLKGLEKLYDRGVVEIRQNATLDKNLFDSTFINESRDKHLLKAILGADAFKVWIVLLLHLLFLELDLENGSIGPITNLATHREVISNQSFLF